MPRAKVTGAGYADKGRSFTKPADVSGEVVRGAGVETLLAPPQTTESAADALKGLATYDEGWLRVVSQDFGKTLFFKFKFSRGQHAGSYVFYRCDDHNITQALWGLLGKVQKVYDGTLRPTPDTPYD